MAITKSRSSQKSPSQSPTAFFQGKQSGGAYGGGNYTAPAKLAGGPMREKIMGEKRKS